MRRWLGLGANDDAQIDTEEFVRDHPEEDPDFEAAQARAEDMHEAWLDRIGGES